MAFVADTPEGSKLIRLLAKADSRNQVVLDAASDRVALTGPGVVFVTSPHFADGEWREYPPRVRVDGGETHRLAFGTCGIEMTPGVRHLFIASGAPLSHRHGVDVTVDVPTDGSVTLLLTDGFLPYQSPSVAPAPDSADRVRVG